MGRTPFQFDAELAQSICDRLATSEQGLEDILDELRVLRGEEKITPGLTTIYKWMDENKEFAESSARARKFQAQILHDRAQRVAREPLIGRIEKTVITDKGSESQTTVADNVERSKLIVQTLLKRAGQLDSKKYGDKVQTEHSGEVQVGLQLVHSVPRPERKEDA